MPAPRVLKWDAGARSRELVHSPSFDSTSPRRTRRRVFTNPFDGCQQCNVNARGTAGAQARACMARKLLRRLVRFRVGTSGANLVEAAVVTPLLLLLTFAIADFGVMFYAYLALENGVSQATRYAVTGNQMTDPNGDPMARDASIKTAMRQATPTLTLPDSAFSFSHMAPGGSGWLAGTGGPNDIEKVSVNYAWDVMTPLMRPFFPGGQVVLHVESAMKNEPRFN